MSELSCHRAVERLLAHLEHRGLMERLELSDEDIADTIWLALQMGVVETKTQEKQPNRQQQTSEVIIEDGKITKAESTPEADSTINIYSQDSITQDSITQDSITQDSITQDSTTQEESESEDSSKGLPFQAPAAAALQNKLPISRALRPLMRKVPSAIKTILDAEATVTRIAERDIWLPVTKPEPERWLQLELVVEESRSSFIWTETIDELQKLLQNHGAFRTVRVWSLSSTDNDDLQLTRRRKGGQKSYSQHSYRELIHSNGRGLILLVSDCVSSIWQQGKIHQWLQKWSNKVPTAIMQLFPERLWQSSELGLGYKLQLSAFTPGVPNYDLVLSSLWEELKGEQVLKLPVVTLEAFSLGNWAKVVAGRGNTRTPGFVFDLDFVAEQIKKRDKKSATVKLQEPLPEELVDRFLATASPTAQRLAGLMAAAPVSLPVVNLIQKTFLPNKSTPVNVAEVFLSGMIQRINASDNSQPLCGSQKSKVKSQNPQYDFVPEVRKLLNQATRLGETENVLDVVSSYIADNLGLSIKSFTALLLRHQDLSPEQQEQILPFATVTIEVLKNLGGEYANFAEQVAASIAVSPPPEPESEDEQTPEPKLKTCTFEIATVEIEETRTFEFDVATLERKSQLLGFVNRWVINRQQKQATSIIEVLEGGIELELMEIPGGSFLMGSPEDELERFTSESPQHTVTISPFRMGKYPVTQAQWRTVANMHHLRVNRDLEPDPSRFKGDDRPVEQVSWYDAVEFCVRLSRFAEGRLSQYTGKEYRLPSEAEWEYACRAGTTTPFHFGETITSKLANYDANYAYGRGPKGKYREETTPVGSFKVANAFGLYDMHGNVWEWCLDDWHSNYENAPTDGSAWFDDKDNNLDQKSGYAVLRGGSWIYSPYYCRSAYRYYIVRAVRDSFLNYGGFRVVCAFGRTSS